jgi:hypothetical protein
MPRVQAFEDLTSRGTGHVCAATVSSAGVPVRSFQVDEATETLVVLHTLREVLCQ